MLLTAILVFIIPAIIIIGVNILRSKVFSAKLMKCSIIIARIADLTPKHL